MAQSLKIKVVTPYVTLNDVFENDILETFAYNLPSSFYSVMELIEKLKKKSILITLVIGKEKRIGGG